MNAFRCQVYNQAALTVAACVKRHHQAARDGQVADIMFAIRPCASACARCPVGAAHSIGELPEAWPSGVAVQRFSLPVTASEPPKRADVRRRAPRAPRGVLVTSATGEQRTVSGWARTVGMLAPTLRARLGAGLPLEQALAANATGRPWTPRETAEKVRER
jgi:hypothetical protein